MKDYIVETYIKHLKLGILFVLRHDLVVFWISFSDRNEQLHRKVIAVWDFKLGA